MTVNFERIGIKIKEVRKKSGITQAVLAELVDVGTTHLCRVEIGTKKPSLTLLIKIAYTLNVSINDLIDGSIII